MASDVKTVQALAVTTYFFVQNTSNAAAAFGEETSLTNWA